MTYALVANAKVGGANGGTTSGIDTSGASLLVVAITTFSVTPSAGELSDSKGNTYTKRTTYSSSSRRVTIFYCTNPTVGSGHTFTYASTNSFSLSLFSAFSGANTSAPYDQENGDNGNTGQPGSVTPSEDNELVFTAIATDVGSGTPTIDSGFTVIDSAPNVGGSYIGGGIAYKIQTTAAAVSPAWTWTSSSQLPTSIATFKAATAAGNSSNYYAQQQ